MNQPGNKYTMQQILEWEIKNDFKLLPWQRVFLLHTLNGGIVTSARRNGRATVLRAAEGIRADTLILDEVHVMSHEEVVALGESHIQAHKDKVAGTSSVDRAWDDIDKTIAADLGSHPMFRPQLLNVLPDELSEFRHVDIYDDVSNGQRAIDYIKKRYGGISSVEFKGYNKRTPNETEAVFEVRQDNTGLFQTQQAHFKQNYGKVDTARQHLERRITNQRKELKRLNACLKMQAAQAIQQGKRFDLRTRQNGILEDRNTQLQRQLEHERALSAYWHNEFKALKKSKKKGKK